MSAILYGNMRAEIISSVGFAHYPWSGLAHVPLGEVFIHVASHNPAAGAAG